MQTLNHGLEPARLAALRSYGVLDTPAEAGFDSITSAAASACETPMALISLVDAERQWFKSKVGLCVSETSRDVAFCTYAIERDEALVIPDATLDDRTKDNPLVLGDPFIRFYAGIPLRNADGFALGTLCVLDTQPRELTAEQLSTLKSLAHEAVAQLELRRKQAASLRASDSMRRSRYQIGRPVLLTLAATLTMTAFSVVQSRSSTQAIAEQRFERLNEHVLDEVNRRVTLPVYGLKGARGVYAGSQSVERHEFEAYVESRDLAREFPGVLGFGFIQRVARADLDSFVAAERLDDAPNFAVREFPNSAPALPDLYVVKDLYPLGRNEMMWGIDAGSEPSRRAAIERAILSGLPTISPAVTMIQDPGLRRGFLSLVAVYRNGTRPETAAERRQSLVGLLYAPIVMDDAMAGVAAGVDSMVALEVFDGPAPDPANRLYGSDDLQPSASVGQAHGDGQPSKLMTLEVGGRTWCVRTRATPKFVASTNQWTPYAAGIRGAIFSVLLSAFVWSLGRSRTRAIALAESMTVDLSAARDMAVGSAQALRASADVLRRTGELARVGGWELDAASERLTWSDEVYRIHQLDVGAPISVARWISFYEPEGQEILSAAIEAAKAAGTPWDLELPLVTAKGKHLFVRTQGECVREPDGALKLRGAFQDITTRKAAETLLRRSATHDKLTGLPNRALLAERLQKHLSRGARGRGFAVLFMDFDRFKWTNDTLGHDAGDDLLIQIAARLRHSLGADKLANDAGSGTLVGRLGGDEFVVILDAIDDADGAEAAAAQLLGALAAPYRIRGHEVVSTASIGIVLSDARYTRPDEMLRDADIAMYEAKLAGKARSVTFDSAMYERVQRKQRTEADLRSAIESESQLSLAFQPIVSLETGEVRCVEALARWDHPTRGLLSAEAFIAIAEESGLILPLGDWVLRAACEQFAQWQRTLGTRAPRSISINLSKKQMAVRELPDKVAAIILAAGVRPESVHLELTENSLMRDPKQARELLHRLREVGVKIDMDDFGTGHSSLAMLHELPIDGLKIDPSLVHNLDRGREFAAILQAISQLARNLNIDVIAEGVETDGQLTMLQALDFTAGQGHRLGHPVSAATFESSIMDRETVTPSASFEDRTSIAA